MRRTHLHLVTIACIALTAAAPALAVAAGPIPPLNGFTGNVGVYAVTLDTNASGFSPLQTIEHNPDVSFPLASSFKPLILHQVLAAVDAGAITWKQKINIAAADHSLDQGRVPRRSRVKRLAKKMIARSHNTSTDLLFKLVGLGAPSVVTAAWGLGDMRVVAPTREFWLALSGLVPDVFPSGDLPAAAAAYAGLSRANQVAAIELVRASGAGFATALIEAQTDAFYAFDAFDQTTTFGILDNIDNLASAREMVQLYHRLFFDNGLSSDSSALLRKLMSRGDRRTDKRSIQVRLKYWGGKGGSDLGMGSVAGYGLTRNGNHVLYAIMGSHMTNEDADWTRIEAALAWLFASLG